MRLNLVGKASNKTQGVSSVLIAYKPLHPSLSSQSFSLYSLPFCCEHFFDVCICIMDMSWTPPPVSTLKVSVHGAVFRNNAPNGNMTDLGVVLRRSSGALVSSILGAMPHLSPVANELWAIYAGMRRAFVEAKNHVIIETDNMVAFAILKFRHNDIPITVRVIVNQILALQRTRSWRCSIRFMYPARNRVVTYLTLLGGQIFTRTCLVFEALGGAAELLDLGIDSGTHNPDYIEMKMSDEEDEQLELLMIDAAGSPLEFGEAAKFIQNLDFNNVDARVEVTIDPCIHELIFKDEREV